MKTIIFFISLMSLTSCTKFLDEKPNQSWVIPSSLQDAQALMDNYFAFNSTFSPRGMQADDNYYLLDNYYNTLQTINQENYRWEKELYNNAEWRYMYNIVLYSNIALETAMKIVPGNNEINLWNQVAGSAYFHRGHAFYQTAQYYAEPYDKNSASQKLGIPLRLDSDINIISTRSSLEETWQQIVSDLKQAAALLPVTVPFLSRPTKQAAYAMLARTFLTMEDYPKAWLYADSCLQLQNGLINYNTLNPAASNPFSQFNQEVIFSAVAQGSSALNATNWRCDSVLYASYHINDLRKTCFYRSNGTNTYGFKGNYDGSTAVSFFVGPAVDEIYLIRAEALARTGNTAEAMNDLNKLLITRWKTGTFVPFTAATPDQALDIILEERRKELVMRGTRWFDLRRLNKDPRYAKTLIRKINGDTYTLPPNDPRYTQYIPPDVIALTGMQQNTR